MTAQRNYWVVVYDDPQHGEMLSREVDTREQALSLACALLNQPVSVCALRGPGGAEVTLEQIKRECAAKAHA